MKYYHLLLIVALLAVPSVEAAIIDWDGWSSDDCGDGGFSCGTQKDNEIWVGDTFSFEIETSSTITDAFCADLRDDGVMESCVYIDSGDFSDCEAAFSEVDAVPSDSNFLCAGGDYDDCGWGFFQDDQSSASLSGDYLVCPGGHNTCTDIQGSFDSNNPRDGFLQFYSFNDCDNSEGQRGRSEFDNEDITIVDTKGLICEDLSDPYYVSSKWYIDGVDDGYIDFQGRNCEFFDGTFGAQIGYCDTSQEFNTSFRTEKLNTSVVCKLNFTIVDNLYDKYNRPCRDDKITNGTNETLVDYGGLCGNCTVSNVSRPEDDISWAVARELFVSDNGRITFDNPFDDSYCEQGEPAATIPVIVILILLLISAVLGGLLIIFILGVASFLVTTASRRLILFGLSRTRKFIKKRRNKK